ncbi:MAG: ACP phosphodiesterase [Bacteroidales bacterium]
MNFLAHLYLSPNDPEIIFGNFIADAVRGRDFDRYPENVKKGILLHRFIDQTTDTHPLFLRACGRLKPFTGRFAGVAADIIFDHFLAADWPHFSSVVLSDFAQQRYQLVEAMQEWLPPKAARTFHYMKTNNWLVNYADRLFMERVFKGMSGRVHQGQLLLNSWEALNGNYFLLKKDFEAFFPELISLVKAYRL